MKYSLLYPNPNWLHHFPIWNIFCFFCYSIEIFCTNILLVLSFNLWFTPILASRHSKTNIYHLIPLIKTHITINLFFKPSIYCSKFCFYQYPYHFPYYIASSNPMFQIHDVQALENLLSFKNLTILIHKKIFS